MRWAFFSLSQNERQDSLIRHPISNRETLLLPKSPAPQPALMVLNCIPGLRTRNLINCHLTLYSLTLGNCFSPGSPHLGKCGEPSAHLKLSALFLKRLPRLGKVQLSAQFQVSFSHPGPSLQCFAALSPGVDLLRKGNFAGMESGFWMHL